LNSKVRMTDRFKKYTSEDCSCIYCLFYAGRGKLCPLETCCCEQERAEALEQEPAREK
jgi:hypothetical protein